MSSDIVSHVLEQKWYIKFVSLLSYFLINRSIRLDFMLNL